MNQDNFLLASRKKLRFSTTKGSVGVEELWDLPLETLNTIAVKIHTSLQGTQVSFLNQSGETTKGQKEDELRLGILKTVIATRQAEEISAKDRQRNAAQLALLKEIQATRQMDALKTMSPDELAAKIKALEQP